MGSYQKTYMVHAILSEYIVRRPMYSGRPFIPLGHSSHMTEHNCCVNVIGFCLAWYLFCYPRHHPSWVPLTMAQGIVHRCENYISCSKRRRRRKIVMKALPLLWLFALHYLILSEAFVALNSHNDLM